MLLLTSVESRGFATDYMESRGRPADTGRRVLLLTWKVMVLLLTSVESRGVATDMESRGVATDVCGKSRCCY